MSMMMVFFCFALRADFFVGDVVCRQSNKHTHTQMARAQQGIRGDTRAGGREVVVVRHRRGERERFVDGERERFVVEGSVFSFHRFCVPFFPFLFLLYRR